MKALAAVFFAAVPAGMAFVLFAILFPADWAALFAVLVFFFGLDVMLRPSAAAAPPEGKENGS